MSLLDFLSSDDAQLGLGLLAAGGPSTTPMSFGQRLAAGVGQAQASKDARMRNQFVQSQIDENKAQIAARNQQAQRDREIQQLVQNRMAGGAGPVAGAGAAGGDAQAPGTFAIGVNPMLPGRPLGAPPAEPQGYAGSSSGSGSAFPFTLNDITQLQGMGYKGADNLFNMYKYANDGIKREAGAYYVDPATGRQRYYAKIGEGQTIGPGGMVATAPGYATSNAEIKGTEAGAQAAAQAPHQIGVNRAKQVTEAALDTQPYVGADGNTYYGSRLGSVIASGAGPMIGIGGGPAGAPAAATPAPLIGREFGGGASPAAGSPVMSARNPITQQSAIALNDNWIKNNYQPAIDAGRVANDLQASIQAARNVDMNTGWGTEAKANAASVLEGLGIASGSAKMYAANAQKFQSIAMDKLMTTLQAQKGPQTEGDSDRAKQTFISLKNTPEANAFIMDFAQAKANMDQRRAQYFEQALPLAQRAGDLTRVDREWRKIQGSIWGDPILQRWSK